MMIKVFLVFGIVVSLAIVGCYFVISNQNRVIVPLAVSTKFLSDEDAQVYSKIVLEESGLWVDGMQIDRLAYDGFLIGRNSTDNSRYIVPWIYFADNGEKFGVTVYLTVNSDHAIGEAVRSK